MQQNHEILKMIEEKVHLHSMLEYASTSEISPMVKLKLLEEFGSFVALKSIINIYERYKSIKNSARIGSCPCCGCDPCDCHGVKEK